MKIDVKVPAVGESITEAVIGSWTKKSGEYVKMNEVILLLETDKASVEVAADKDGILTTTAAAGDTVKIGATIGSIDTDGKPTAAVSAPANTATETVVTEPTSPASPASPANKDIHADLKNHLSPAVQRVVNEKGLDANSISGTGQIGRASCRERV